jgi:hypothetical protein
VNGNGFGYGINLHYPTSKVLSTRLNYFSSNAIGLSTQPWYSSTQSGGLAESFYQPYQNNDEGWFPSYQFSQSTLELEALLSLSKLLNKPISVAENEGLDFYLIGSFGIFDSKTKLDLLDEKNEPYLNLQGKTFWTPSKYDLKSGRKEIEKSLNTIYDGKYETEVRALSSNKTYSFGGGIKFNFSPSIIYGFEYKRVNFYKFDYADGLKFIRSSSVSGNSDAANYFALVVEYKL